MPYPKDPNLRGLAAVTHTSDIPNWEFDIRAVPFGEDPTEISDWHRRKGRARKSKSTREAAEAGISPVRDKGSSDGTTR